jgi:cardiolipin synthase
VARTGEDRILTVPNALSVIRLAFIPLFLWLLFGRENRHAAAWLLAALCASDWLDGYIARHFNQVSNLGKILDPTADRILLGVGGIAIIVDGSIPAWIGILALTRELVVGVAGIVLGLMGARRIDVLLVGKAGNFLLMLAFPLFLASHSEASWNEVAGFLAWLCVIPGLVLSYYSAYRYVPLAKDALGKGR